MKEVLIFLVTMAVFKIVVDGMFMVMNRLDIMLVVELVVQHTVISLCFRECTMSMMAILMDVLQGVKTPGVRVEVLLSIVQMLIRCLFVIKLIVAVRIARQDCIFNLYMLSVKIFTESVMDGMLVIMHWFDIMFVIVGVVKRLMHLLMVHVRIIMVPGVVIFITLVLVILRPAVVLFVVLGILVVVATTMMSVLTVGHVAIMVSRVVSGIISQN